MTQAVDLQVLLPKVQDVGRMQKITQSNEEVQQQNFAAQLNREAQVAQRSVQYSPQAREARVQEQDRRQQRQPPRKQQGGTHGKRSGEVTGERVSTGVRYHLDLKI